MSDTLAVFLVKWLTHDLATPIATVMTASELLGDTFDPEINDLVSDGAKRLGARLRLIRAALASGDGPVGAGALRNLICEGVAVTPVSWSIPVDAADLPAPLIAGAAMLMADLRRGQALDIATDSVRWASEAAFPDPVALALTGGGASDTRSAIAEMLLATAARAGLALTIVPDGLAWH
jgi:signal transduction histidine kinase